MRKPPGRWLPLTAAPNRQIVEALPDRPAGTASQASWLRSRLR